MDFMHSSQNNNHPGINKSIVSVIIPAFNREDTIVKCISSILNQTYNKFEIIIVDDGSTDETMKICNDFAEKDSRIKVFHTENNGASSARNTGLDNSSGEFVMFVDSDDYIDSNMIEATVNLMALHKVNMVSCTFTKRYYKNGEMVSVRKFKVIEGLKDGLDMMKNFEPFAQSEPKKYAYFEAFSQCGKLYKKEIIDKNKLRFVNLKMGEDIIFNLFYIYFAKTIYSTNESSYNYISWEGNQTNSTDNETTIVNHLKSSETACNYFYSFLSRNNLDTVYINGFKTHMLCSYIYLCLQLLLPENKFKISQIYKIFKKYPVNSYMYVKDIQYNPPKGYVKFMPYFLVREKYLLAVITGKAFVWKNIMTKKISKNRKKLS